jgi:serine/threonine-protein kinase SRK2
VVRSPSGTARSKPAVPDFGLASTHEVQKLLGRGGEGETWLCREKATGAEVAIKLIRRPIPKPAIAVIKREVKIQSDLGQGHLNIVSANEVLLSKTHLGLVLEYVPGTYVPSVLCAWGIIHQHSADAT